MFLSYHQCTLNEIGRVFILSIFIVREKVTVQYIKMDIVRAASFIILFMFIIQCKYLYLSI
jgi:hypothetical protein